MKPLSTSAQYKMNTIPHPVTSSSSSHLQQQYDDKIYALLPRFEISDFITSSALFYKYTSSVTRDRHQSVTHEHKHDTNLDTNITTKNQKHHDCMRSDTSMKLAYFENDKNVTNHCNSSATEIDSAFIFTSISTVNAAQDNANNTEEIGIAMRSDVYEKGWLRRYKELIAFKHQNGHCYVPQRYEHNKALSKWISNQRKHYKLSCQGKPWKIKQERIAALEEIGFEWNTDYYHIS